RICSSVIPSPSFRRMSSTVMRVPLITGLPNMILGSTVMRSCVIGPPQTAGKNIACSLDHSTMRVARRQYHKPLLRNRHATWPHQLRLGASQSTDRVRAAEDQGDWL